MDGTALTWYRRRVKAPARISIAVSSNLKNRLSAEGARWSARVFDELRALGEEIAVAYG